MCFQTSNFRFCLFFCLIFFNIKAQSLQTNPNLQLTTFCKGDSLQILFSISSSELAYKRESESGTFSSRLNIQYGLQKKTNEFKILGETFLELKAQSQLRPMRIISASVTLNARLFKSEVLSIQFADVHTGKTQIRSLSYAELCNAQSRFKLIENGQWMAKPHLQTGREYTIEFADTFFKSLELQYFSFNHIIPHPVDDTEAQQTHLPVSTQTLHATNGVFTLQPLYDGLYVFHCNAQNTGICMYASAVSDLWTMASDLYWPVLYLLNPKDRNTIQKTMFHKQDLDSVWLALCKSKILARKVIKSYYKRVNNAHVWYSDASPGAFTDQGMTYILFGKPTQVIQYNNEETWIYGPLGSPSTVRFNFTKTETPNCNCKPWILNRSTQYADMLESAIESWKLGQISE